MGRPTYRSVGANGCCTTVRTDTWLPAAGHPDDRLVQVHAARRAEELGVAEGEDATVRRHQPVAPTREGAHADHRLVEWRATRRAQEGGVAEGEHPAVRGHEAVALPGRRRGHAHD